MVWSSLHDEMLCREILTHEPYNYKAGTQQRGEVWKSIAESLNSLDKPIFSVNQRAVRERYTLLERSFKQNVRKEEQATGIAPDEPSDFQKAMEEIVDKMTQFEIKENNNAKVIKERETATEMRRQSMETYRETEKRKNADGENKTNTKRRRRSGDETVEYLREKMETERLLRERELNIAQLNAETMQKLLIQQQQQNQAMLTLLMESRKNNK